MKLPTRPLGPSAAVSVLSSQTRTALLPRLSLATPAPTHATASAAPAPLGPACRTYATQQQQSSGSGVKRRAVTPFNDDGAVHWSQLSGGEKAARATGQSVNFGLVLVGVAMTGGVAYFLFTDVIDTESKTAWFNRAVGRIKKDPACLSLLGEAGKIAAHGDETGNKWRRARPITYGPHRSFFMSEILFLVSLTLGHFSDLPHTKTPRVLSTCYCAFMQVAPSDPPARARH